MLAQCKNSHVVEKSYKIEVNYCDKCPQSCPQLVRLLIENCDIQILNLGYNNEAHWL